MQVFQDIAGLRTHIARYRRDDQEIALVPTMGNLHAGHIALVKAAREACERVVVSIYVNPLQFGAGEDFDAYPRTLEADRQKLEAAGAHVLFAPSDREIYPQGREHSTTIDAPEALTHTLCGASRPGHFRGVTTVVAKLFNIVQPTVAVFGEKDFQQLRVIQRMTADLNLPIRILGLPTHREADGLAMSSRNGYLSAEERSNAPLLYAQLQWAAEQLRAGEIWDAIEAEGLKRLSGAGFVPDYFTLRDAENLQPLTGWQAGDAPARVLLAARLGQTRLIDNLSIS
jgi:pantoate--beta-alanine ligase